jgi:hypothetical protein
VDEGPKSPPTKISKLALVLILFNWIAAPGFLFVAYLDHMVRVQYSYRTSLNYVQIYGLPLKAEEDTATFAVETRPLLVLNAEQLKEAFRKRPGIAPSVREEFAPFEETVDNRISYRMRPSDMTKSVLDDIFQGQPDPVATLEEAIEKAKGKLEGDIAAASKEAIGALGQKKEADKRAIMEKSLYTFSWDAPHAKKLEEQLAETKGADLDTLVKRQVIRNTLFTMAPDVWQIKALEERLAQAKPADLDAMLDDALQRRMYYDLLAPINVFRPGESKDYKNYKIEQLADVKKYPLKDVQDLARDLMSYAIADKYDEKFHLGGLYPSDANPKARQRDSIEKRQMVSFIMFALAHVNVPVVERRLYPKGIERAQIVSGLYEFTNSAIYFTRTQRILEDRLIRGIRADRQGYTTEIDDKVSFTPGFTIEYEAEIDRLVKIQAEIDSAEKRLADTKTQLAHYKVIHEQRVTQHKETLKQLIAARERTEKYAEELHLLQDQLHDALVELSTAGETNQRLFEEIREISLRFIAEEAAREKAKQPKGKKRP